MDNTIYVGIFWSALLSAVVLFLAWRGNFFQLPRRFPIKLSFWVFAGGFLIYLIYSGVVLPLTASLFVRKVADLDPIARGWLQFGALCILAALFCIYFYLLRPWIRRAIFWGEREHTSQVFWKSALVGAITLLISYPVVLLISQLAALLSLAIWGTSGVEQVAVRTVKESLGSPLLYAFSLFVVIVVVPVIEEFLFRGLLQTFLKRFMPRLASVALSATIFALFHFSKEQGTGNLELLLSLFALSCFIGFVYEREQTLWASISMHGLFNGISTIFIALS